MRGSYILLVDLATGKDILIGKLGYISFPKAFYAYVGSAMSGFKVRLTHHLKDNRKPHWHIDYLLNEAELADIILCPSEPFTSFRASAHQGKLREESHSAQGRLRVECFLAQALAKEFQFIPGFGSSDCKCRSHLYFAAEESRLEAKVAEVASPASLSCRIFSPKERENGAGV